MTGVGQRAEERFIEAFISQLAVKAFNEAVLLGFFPVRYSANQRQSPEPI